MKLFLTCQTILRMITAPGIGLTAQRTANTESFSRAYKIFTLDKGLADILHEDHLDPMVVVGTDAHMGSNRWKR